MLFRCNCINFTCIDDSFSCKGSNFTCKDVSAACKDVSAACKDVKFSRNNVYPACKDVKSVCRSCETVFYSGNCASEEEKYKYHNKNSLPLLDVYEILRYCLLLLGVSFWNINVIYIYLYLFFLFEYAKDIPEDEIHSNELGRAVFHFDGLVSQIG